MITIQTTNDTIAAYLTDSEAQIVLDQLTQVNNDVFKDDITSIVASYRSIQNQKEINEYMELINQLTPEQKDELKRTVDDMLKEF